MPYRLPRRWRSPPRHPVVADLGVQRLHEPGFTNPSFATDQDHLPWPSLLCTQRSSSRAISALWPTSLDGLSTAASRSATVFPHHPAHPQRLGDAPECLEAEVIQRKYARQESSCNGTDHHGIGCRHPFEPGGNVGGLTQSQILLPAAAPHLAHHHQPRVEAEPHCQPHTALTLQARIEGRGDGLDYPQAGQPAALHGVFVCLWPAKIDQQAIPQILRNMAVELVNDRRRLLIGADDLPQV